MFNIAQKEKEILDFWKRNKIFKKSLDKNKKGKAFIFYEGPPYANGRPGIHHVVARCFKDIVLRYKTMKGFYVRRKAGWDTHGLPAEIAAEKALGIKSKKEIEKIGVEKFIKICKENVFTYKKEWEEFTERIGYWLDMKNPYITCTNEYIESLFFVIKKFYEKGLLYKDNKVVPWCPRCQTTLASHELAQGYKKIKENSIYVKLKIKDKKFKKNTFILIWTTTPWTLPGNVAVAFNPKIKYAIVKTENSNFILAKERVNSVFGKESYKSITEIKAKDILGIKYEPLFPQKVESKQKERIWRVYSADFVSSEEGTGFVHIAPAFGEDDFNLGKENNLPAFLTVNEEGKMKKGVIGEKKFVKEADEEIIENLKKRKLLFKEEIYEHDYPFCWRCDTPLLYYLHPSWFVATKKIKNKLISNNKKIKWHPQYFKYGRFGNFLEEVRDWNFSRERYWGTPLPIWECDNCKNIEVIGSREDLLSQTFSKNRYFLLRHGLAETNVKKILSSDPKKKYKLTKEGKKQIKDAARRLKKLLKNNKIDLIFSSDIYRCKQSAEILKKEIGFKGKIIYSERLRDINPGEWEGKKLEDFQKEFLEDPERYLFEGPRGGESWNDFKKRMFDFISDIEKNYQGKNIIIVSHGDPLWALYGALNGWDNNEILKNIKTGKGHFRKGELRETEFKIFPYNEKGELDFHRPYIDRVVFVCKKCGQKMKRVKEVCDVWFDSGAMPFAQDYWPFSQNKNLLKTKTKKLIPPTFFPADFICEGIDQTRGWFYTLLAVSSLLGFSSPYKEVLSTGLVMDKYGKKMSKSRGNIISPWEMSEKYGADTLRWYFYTINQPWDVKNFDEDDVKKCFNRFLLTLYNSLNFYQTYYGKPVFSKKKKINSQNILDKWILSKLAGLNRKVEKFLEKYNIVSAAREIDYFLIEDLSNWYIRRSRERFQRPKSKKDLEEAGLVLGYVLFEISKLLAPFVPFSSEIVYQAVTGKKNLSVHLDDYPKVNKKFINKSIEKKMEKIREIAKIALSQRRERNIQVRQPLKTLKIKSNALKNDKDFLEILKAEINVKEIIFDGKIKKEIELDTEITEELKREGIFREITRHIQFLRKNLGLTKNNLVDISFAGDKYLMDIIKDNKNNLKRETLARNIEMEESIKEKGKFKVKIGDKNLEIFIKRFE